MSEAVRRSRARESATGTLPLPPRRIDSISRIPHSNGTAERASLNLWTAGASDSRASDTEPNHDSRRLPQEVWAIILDYLWNEQKALIACNLTCHAWVSITRRHLWNTVKCVLPWKIQYLRESLKSFPERGTLIRCLEIEGDLLTPSSLVSLLSNFINLETLTIGMLKYMHRAGVHISEESLKAITLPRLSTLSLLYSTWETVTLGRLLCAFPRLTTLYMKRIVFSDEGEQWDSIDPSIRDDLVARLAGLHLKTLTWYCGAVWEELDGLLISSPLCRGLRKLSLPGAYGITVGHKVATAFPILRTAGPSLDALTLMVSTRDEDEAGLDLLDFSLNTNLSTFHIGILAGGHRSYWADRPASVLRRLVGSPAMYSLRRLDLYLLLYDCTQPPPDNYMRPSNARLGDIIVSMLRDNSHLIITFHARGSAYAAGVARRVLAEYVVRCAPEFVATDAQTRLRLIHDLAVFGSEHSPLNMGHWEPGWEDTDISGSVALLDAEVGG